jgi:hypothetical protein
MLTYYEYAALSKTPHALADGLMLVLQYPVGYKAGPADWTTDPPSNIINDVRVKSRF